jgi:NTP pyrophosphatase (non-canonical NTP hydrolase)
MLFSDYAAFVARIDQSTGKTRDARIDIAVYGLAAEIGSLFAAVKKAMLATQSGGATLVAESKRAEVLEEAGDVLWYCVALGQLHNRDTAFALLKEDVRNLHDENSAADARANRIERELTPERKAKFLEGAATFLTQDDTTLGDYQRLAFLTARTEGHVLERVCLAVLSQLGTEVLRTTLPEVELDLNKKVVDRPLNVVLGEIVWHLAAVATLNEMSLDEVAVFNQDKLVRRYGRAAATTLPDTGFPPHERFPRKLEIVFVTVGRGRSRMYFGGRPLGNDLTDNALSEDGYRFHDVVHLALLAKLGWSPVIRKLMGRKRKSQPDVDEVQDGARALIVEELVIKAIHSECAALFHGPEMNPEAAMLANRGLVSFRFLSMLSRLVIGLESEQNQYWEWEEAIFEGGRLFRELGRFGQGTIALDLDARTIGFSKDVHIDLRGTVAGVGSASFDIKRVEDELVDIDARRAAPEGQAALVEAILQALGLDGTSAELRGALQVHALDRRRVTAHATGRVREACWALGALAFQTSWTCAGGTITCTAFALADPRDAMGSQA